MQLTIRNVLSANLINIALHLVLEELQLLPYPLAPALIVGSMASTLITAAVSMMVCYTFALCLHDVAVRRDEFERLSTIDMLSGLKNRRAFFQEVGDDHPAGLFVLIDVDRFKAVNDVHGHLVGDAVIEGIGRVMMREFDGEGAVTARLGGEEFAAVLGTEGRPGQDAMAERLREAISLMRIDPMPNAVTVSIGLAEMPVGRPVAEAYAAADKALYWAKASGRNRVVHEAEIDELPRRCLSAGALVTKAAADGVVAA